MNRVCFFAVGLAVLFIAFSGCGGKKTGNRNEGGQENAAMEGPTWLKPDKSKFGKLSDSETNLEGGTITVYDPEGWRREPPGRDFVIAFKKDGALLRMTKSKTVEDMPDIDMDNIEEFAEDVQQLFKAPTQMLEIGNLVGVMFSKQVADRNRMSKKLNCRVFATSINGRLFTYELISPTITDAQLGVLYAVIATTVIRESGQGVAVTLPPEPSTPEEPVVAAAASAAEPPSEPAKPEEPVAAASPAVEPQSEPAKTPEPVVAAAPPAVEPQPEPAKTPEPVVAAAPPPKPEAKPEPPKPAPVRDRRSTRTVLKELEETLKKTDGGG